MLFFTFIIAILDATLSILYDCNRNDFALGLPDYHRYIYRRSFYRGSCPYILP